VAKFVLRETNTKDTACLLSINKKRAFPGILGSINCMHWEWKNCPSGWQRKFKGHAKGCTVILEATASHDRWILHYYGMEGSNNNTNVLRRFARLAEGNVPHFAYEINGNPYDKGYYISDGI
jgi:hypothetical protein